MAQIHIKYLTLALVMGSLLGVSACLPKNRTISYVAQKKLTQVHKNVEPNLHQLLRLNKTRMGDQIFMRVFKQEAELELWMKPHGKREYILLKTYPICYFSGNLGPKLKEGDKQAPEGFYDITLPRLHPESENHLAFNLGYPNAYDRSKGRTGSYLMIHGGCNSIGCYAMTDAGIEEIYVLVEAALNKGQDKIDVHIFPFRMSEEKLLSYRSSEWFRFWWTLNTAYQSFERTHIPPIIKVDEAGDYRFYEMR